MVEQLNVPVKILRANRPAGVVSRCSTGVRWPLAVAVAFAATMSATLTIPEEKDRANEIEELTVASPARGADGRHFPNRHIIMARRQNGEVVTVRVVDSAKYRPMLRIGGQPMTFKARPANHGNCWVRVGREPRYPGQW